MILDVSSAILPIENNYIILNYVLNISLFIGLIALVLGMFMEIKCYNGKPIAFTGLIVAGIASVCMLVNHFSYVSGRLKEEKDFIKKTLEEKYPDLNVDSNYKGEEFILSDDNGQIKYSVLVEALEGYKYRINIVPANEPNKL